MNNFHLLILCEDTIQPEVFEQFYSDVTSDGFVMDIASRPSGSVFASVEWFIPAAIVAYFSKSYFDAFLKEAGKDHYQTLKNSLSKLTKEVLTTPRVEPTLYGSKGKLNSNNDYSLALSIEAEANGRDRFKLLLAKSESNEYYVLSVEKFLEFISDFHEGKKSLESIDCLLDDRRAPGGMIFVRLNPHTHCIEWVDEKAHR